MAAIRVDQTESYRPGFIVLAVPVVKTPPRIPWRCCPEDEVLPAA
jgi:hypothetical protein